ncbi:hypothetical protein ACFL7D_05820 [candidate division KSB1 bacterium]
MNNKISNKILKFIETHPKCSFAELESNIIGFKGDLIFGIPASNIVFWPGMSEEAINAISELIREDKIDIEEVSPIIYAIDSDTFVNLPIGRSSKEYKRPHWLPLAFTVI